ncbi:MAG: enoyl-CoA hydratase-related protein [Burkholderiales bacterium]|jgi:enoyl-CoA hydratase/carnithine racemase
MTPDSQILSHTSDGVATITFNRPDKLNALTPAMLEAFFDAVGQAAADPAARVIVVTGAGRGFSAGLDLGVIGTGQAGGAGEATPRPEPQWGDDIGPPLAAGFSAGWNALIRSRKPTIAAVNGPAFGWGFILALHCDIRFAARSALFNATFARLGVPAEKGIGWLLPRLIGIARAADLLYTARRFDGVEAERIGLINAVLDDDRLMGHVADYAKAIAANAAPRALAAMKAQLWTAADVSYDEGFAAANREQDRCTATADFREGLASYKDKRAPRFTGG